VNLAGKVSTRPDGSAPAASDEFLYVVTPKHDGGRSKWTCRWSGGPVVVGQSCTVSETDGEPWALGVGGESAVAASAIYAGLDPTGTRDSTAALQAFLYTAAVAGRGSIPAGIYRFSNLTIPSTSGDEGGCIIDGAGRKRTTLVCTAASGFGVTFGDGGTFTTNGQEIRNLTIAGNASAAGAVKFFGTRECAIRKVYIHGFTNASAVGVLIDSADHNYFNEIEGCWFENNETHLKLAGSGGIGANSNYIFHNRFETPSGSYAIVIDGGATNRITENEFGSAMDVGVRFENTAGTIYNQVSQNQFDGPTKAWEIAAGGAVTDTDLLFNSGTTAIDASTDGGFRTTRRDRMTEQAHAQVYNTIDQNVANGLATLTWDAEQYDPNGMHDTGSDTERFTIADAGKYRFSLNVAFAPNATGVRGVRVTKNGTATILGETVANAVAGGDFTQLSLCEVAELAAGDYILARSYQTSGGALAVKGGLSPGSRFSVERVA
jgi:hypothetical protein